MSDEIGELQEVILQMVTIQNALVALLLHHGVFTKAELTQQIEIEVDELENTP